MALSRPDAGRLRVLMVVRLFHPWVGGTERQAHKLAQALLDLGVDVQVVTGRWFRGTARSETLDGVPVVRHHTLWEGFGLKGLRKFGGYCYLLTLLRLLWRWRDRYDLIHVHGLNYHTFAAVLAGRRLGKPVVVKLANSGPASDITKMREDRQLALSRFMLPVALRCDRFVALNPQVAAELVAAGVTREAIVELPNGVETRLPQRGDFTLHRPACLLQVGRLHPQKGVDTLLRAFALLLQRWQGPDLVLRLVGDGPARADLRALAQQLGIASQVDFCGGHDDVNPWLRQADVFALASRAEGLSNALLEALAAGLPAVVSDVPGNRDVVEHGRTGLVCPVDDAAALAEALERVLGDERLRTALGTAGRRAAAERYGIDEVAARYVALYDDLLAPPAAAPVPAGGHAGGRR